ncbi:DUF6804 family protein [Homoserinibacter sp. YIM 151385]|uniref:DUF6804 family protein n=1 Tax=Homoserinibacter sp. YIM 151385 TaxID=2985506 RepID=UPI0022F11A22|nr:DUF6804 family protein [Homoserinibacter sp. YIM 151385]WBU38349.1 hypothetical protein OF852_01830 [Homoserinibacter sp. YIM 151385]
MSSTNRYGEPALRRLALAPSILAAIVLLVGVALIESGAFLVIRFAVAILALIVGWFAFQARAWWALPLLLAVAVIWNPVYPLPLEGELWLGAQYLAIIVFIAVGVLVRSPNPDARPQRPGAARGR